MLSTWNLHRTVAAETSEPTAIRRRRRRVAVGDRDQKLLFKKQAIGPMVQANHALHPTAAALSIDGRG